MDLSKFDKMELCEIEQSYIKTKRVLDSLSKKIDYLNEIITKKNDAGQSLTYLDRQKSERAEIDEHLIRECDKVVIKNIAMSKIDTNPEKFITVKEANDNGLKHIVGTKIIKPTYKIKK